MTCECKTSEKNNLEYMRGYIDGVEEARIALANLVSDAAEKYEKPCFGGRYHMASYIYALARKLRAEDITRCETYKVMLEFGNVK